MYHHVCLTVSLHYIQDQKADGRLWRGGYALWGLIRNAAKNAFPAGGRIWFFLQRHNQFGFKSFMTNMEATVEITGGRNENKK